MRAFGGRPLADITSDDIRRFLKQMDDDATRPPA
jgi:hypothetical protein